MRATPTHSRIEPASRISISPVSETCLAQPASMSPVRNPSATEPANCQTSGNPAWKTVSKNVNWPHVATRFTIAEQTRYVIRHTMLLTAMIPSSASLSGPCALHSRSTISVEAGAVAMDIEASNSATCQSRPTASMPISTRIAASADSTMVSLTILPPMRRTSPISNTAPIEKRMSPRATSLSASSAWMFS